MSAPILETVWNNLATAIRAISVAGGYHYDVDDEAVFTDAVNLMNIPQSPAVMLGPSEGSGRSFLASMRVRDRVVFSVEAKVDADGLSTTRKLEAFSRFAADIERAVTRDITRGGYAVRTLVRPPIGPFMGFGAQQQVFFSVDIEIDLIRAYGAS